MNRNPARLTVIVVVLAAVVVATSTVPAGVIAQEQPEIPASYYGEVEIQGFGDAPAGTEVTAIAGDEEDTITVGDDGEYGGPGPFDDKLVLQDPGDDTEVTFEVDGPGFDAVAETDPETVTWESEDVQQVNLTVTGVTVLEDIDLSLDGVSNEIEVEEGDTVSATVTGSQSDGSTTDVTDESTITSDNTSVATVDGDTITAENPGETTISAENSGLEDSVDIVVLEEGEEPTAPGGGGGGGGPGLAPPPDDETEIPPPQDLSPDEAGEIFNPPEGVTIEAPQSNDLVYDLETDTSSTTFGEASNVESVTVGGQIEGSVSVANLNREPDETGPSPGRTATVSQIIVPEGATDNPGTVRMSVSQERLAEIDADAEDLQINRFASGEWQGLETTITEETDTEVRLQANTPGFSYFSVSAVSEPEADITINPTQPDPGTEATLDASGSTDRYGEIVAYDWTVNGESLSGETVGYTFEDIGEFEAELTVENDAGETDTATQTVTVSGPLFEISNIDAPESAGTGDEITVTATIENTGNEGGEQTVSYEFADQTDETTLELDSGAEGTVEFTTMTPEEEGEYTHTLTTTNDEATATTTIEGLPIGIIIGFLVVLVIAVGVGLYAARNSEPADGTQS